MRKQTNILGEQANNIMINGTNDSLALADRVYAAYKERFAAFMQKIKEMIKNLLAIIIHIVIFLFQVLIQMTNCFQVLLLIVHITCLILIG